MRSRASIVALGLIVALSGCGGDPFTEGAQAAAGAGGAAGKAGSSGVAGSAGATSTAGAAGATAGTGGGAGASGSGVGGASGTAGVGGASGSGGAGGMCPIGKFQCLGDALQSCDAMTGQFVTVEACKKGLCDAKLGQCDDCTTGAPVSCADTTTVQTCAANGKAGPTMACPSDQPNCVGKGQCVECVMASQCPAPAKECETATCGGNACGATPATANTVAKTQKAHDCQQNVCDGMGGVKVVADPTDLPADTGDPCNAPACKGTMAGTTPTKAGTSCNGGMGVCNGSGACGECVPGAGKCEGNLVQSCDATGHWGTPTACAKPNPVCSAGVCVAVTSIATSGWASGALLADGTLRGWGGSAYGALGAPSIPAGIAPAPVPIPGVSEVKVFAMSALATCASTASSVSCWGTGYSGELGDGQTGSTVAHPGPQIIAGMPPAVQLASGATHFCALDGAGAVRCWGDNSHGQLGAAGPGPLLMPLGEAAIFISASEERTCAILQSGKATCWGNNVKGDIGNGTEYAVGVPGNLVQGFDNGVSVAVGIGHTCGVQASGAVLCWGDGSHFEFNGTSGEQVQATVEPGLAGWSRLSLGSEFTCGVLNGNPECAGINDVGQLGNGGTISAKFPQSAGLIVGIDGPVAQIVSNSQMSCALVEGDVLCWGAGMTGAVGDGTKMDRTVATPVAW